MDESGSELINAWYVHGIEHVILGSFRPRGHPNKLPLIRHFLVKK